MTKPAIFGDYGLTEISPKVLKAYGISQWPINGDDPEQRRALERLDRIVRAMQEHAWMMETWLTEL